MRGSATLVHERLDEALLVRDFVAGDAAAFDALYAQHHPALVRLLRGRVGSTAAAEDLAQEVMIRAMGRLAEFDHRAPLWPWLRRIAINASIDAMRARSRADALAAHLACAPDRPSAAPDAGEGVLERDVLTRALAEVPARQRAALERCYVEGWRPSEVAADFGVCPNAFDQLLHRARANLRSAYLRQHEEGHRAAHLGWLLAGVSHVEALSGRIRALSAWLGSHGDVIPRLGEAVATVAATAAVAVLSVSGGGEVPPRQAALDRSRAVVPTATTGEVRADPAEPRPAGAGVGSPRPGGGGAPAGPAGTAAPAAPAGLDGQVPAPFTRPDTPPPAADAPGPRAGLPIPDGADDDDLVPDPLVSVLDPLTDGATTADPATSDHPTSEAPPAPDDAESPPGPEQAPTPLVGPIEASAAETADALAGG